MVGAEAGAGAGEGAGAGAGSECGGMQHVFTIEGRCGAARLGTLRLGSGGGGSVAVATPNVLVALRKGSPAGLAPGLYRSRVVVGGDEGLGSPLLATAESVMDDVAGGGVHMRLDRGIHGFYRLHGSGVCLAPRDPSRLNVVLGASRAGVQLDTGGGRRTLSAEGYQALVRSLRPALCFAMSEELGAPEARRRSRAKAAVERTLAWSDVSFGGAGGEGEGEGEGEGAEVPTLAVVAGGLDVASRVACADALWKRHGGARALAGFSVGGLGVGESEAERDELVRAVWARVPEEKGAEPGGSGAALLRHVGGLGSPEAVLWGVAGGVDLFDSSYAGQATLQGSALVFPVAEAEEDEGAFDGGCGGSGTYDGQKVNLRSRDLQRDVRPLLPGCACSTCERHSRAYLHHLLETHEITGTTLLSVHNTHHFARFMAAIRDAVRDQRLDAYTAWFLARRARGDENAASAGAREPGGAGTN